jgi:hypothetical protein
MVLLVAFAMPALIGAVGLAAETSYWYLHKRAMQNAADAAAIAVASETTSSYAPDARSATARAVAAKLGFQNGSGNVNVNVAQTNTATGCPAGQNCYTVTVSDVVPSFFSRVIGYTGNTSTNGVTAISASAVAASGPAYPYCILALNGNVATDFVTHGAPKADLNGCSIMANSSSTCTGHNLNAAHGDAHGTNNGCGIVQHSNMPQVRDPYSGLDSNIPIDTCGGNYAIEPQKKNDPPLPASNQLSGNLSWSGNVIKCGDVQLTGNTYIDAPANAVLVIENGQLDTNGYLLQTTAGSGLTVVFTGSNNSAYQHIPSGGGTLDISAPKTGPWKGVAIYQDPALTTNVNISSAGNSPTWDITGLIYLPNSNVTFSGAVNKASNGVYCFGMVIGTMLVNGTASIFANNTQCGEAGLTQPKGGVRGGLIN